jgi:hypothetical protein
MSIENVMIKELTEVLNVLKAKAAQDKVADSVLGVDKEIACKGHPMLGRRCLIRTYSAGVHIGDVVFVNGDECKLENALRLWSWENGGLSLSAIANNGVKKARLNKTGEIYLTNILEIIATTPIAEATFVKFIEDLE